MDFLEAVSSGIDTPSQPTAYCPAQGGATAGDSTVKSGGVWSRDGLVDGFSSVSLPSVTSFSGRC